MGERKPHANSLDIGPPNRSSRIQSNADNSDVPGVLFEHGVNLLLNAEGGRPPGVLDLAETRRQLVGGGVAADQHEGGEYPSQR